MAPVCVDEDLGGNWIPVDKLLLSCLSDGDGGGERCWLQGVKDGNGEEKSPCNEGQSEIPVCARA